MTSKTSPPTVTLRASELRDLTKPVLPLAGRDDMLPALTTILFETRGDYVVASATDRFRLGVSRIKSALTDPDDDEKPITQPADFRALVPAGHLQRVLAMFKPTRYEDPTLALTLHGNELEVTQAGTLSGIQSASLRFTLFDGEYPDLHKVLLEALKYDGEPAPASGVNAEFLASFKAAVRDGLHLTVRPTAPGRPIVITCGAHFAGVLMPRRLWEEDQNVLTEWRGILGDDTPAEEQPAKPVRKASRKRKTAAKVPA